MRHDWKELMGRETPLLLPAAHDALTARLIERAGFRAYQVGGFALNGARHGLPDLSLTHYAEQRDGLRDIMEGSGLPVLVDADDAGGDVKNVTRVVQGYEALGAAALFFEDQQAPKRCGHLGGKRVVPVEEMEGRIKAAVAARDDPGFFLMARTDAIEPEGLDAALSRGERYMKAGADGLFVEGPRTVEEIERIGEEFHHIPLAINMFDGGGETPWLTPATLNDLGYSMVLYPTSILFRVVHAAGRALHDLKAGIPMPPGERVDLDTFEEILGLDDWEEIERQFAVEPSA